MFGGYDWNGNFSSSDKAVSKSLKLNNYLITPGERFKLYKYKKNEVIEFEGTTYHDSNSKEKGHKCRLCVKK